MNKLLSAALVSLVSLASTQAMARLAYPGGQGPASTTMISCSSTGEGNCFTGWLNPGAPGVSRAIKVTGYAAQPGDKYYPTIVYLYNCSGNVIGTKSVAAGMNKSVTFYSTLSGLRAEIWAPMTVTSDLMVGGAIYK